MVSITVSKPVMPDSRKVLRNHSKKRLALVKPVNCVGDSVTKNEAMPNTAIHVTAKRPLVRVLVVPPLLCTNAHETAIPTIPMTAKATNTH